MLTKENYFSAEMNKKYLGSTQFKDFYGSIGMPGCEARALATIMGVYEKKPSNSMLIGSYVHAHFENELDIFKSQNPDIFTKKGELKTGFQLAEEIIARIERDEYFMQTLSGKKEVPFVAEFFGVEWKVKIDSMLPEAIVDLKTTKSIRDKVWSPGFGKLNFIEFYGYYTQAAIYQKAVEVKFGKRLPFFIAVASKEKDNIDLEVIHIPDSLIDERLSEIEAYAPRIAKIKSGDIEPERCGTCPYCRATRELDGFVSYKEFLENLT